MKLRKCVFEMSAWKINRLLLLLALILCDSVAQEAVTITALPPNDRDELLRILNRNQNMFATSSELSDAHVKRLSKAIHSKYANADELHNILSSYFANAMAETENTALPRYRIRHHKSKAMPSQLLNTEPPGNGLDVPPTKSRIKNENKNSNRAPEIKPKTPNVRRLLQTVGNLSNKMWEEFKSFFRPRPTKEDWGTNLENWESQ